MRKRYIRGVLVLSNCATCGRIISSGGSSELVRVTLNRTVRLCEPNGQSVNGRAGGVDHVGHLLKLSRCGPLEESSRGHGKGSERASKLVEKEGRRRCGRVWFVLVGNEGSRTPSYNPAEFLDGLVEGQTLREPDVKRQPGLVKGYDIGIRVGGVFSKGVRHDDSGRISFACFCQAQASDNNEFGQSASPPITVTNQNLQSKTAHYIESMIALNLFSCPAPVVIRRVGGMRVPASAIAHNYGHEYDLGRPLYCMEDTRRCYLAGVDLMQKLPEEIQYGRKVARVASGEPGCEPSGQSTRVLQIENFPGNNEVTPAGLQVKKEDAYENKLTGDGSGTSKADGVGQTYPHLHIARYDRRPEIDVIADAALDTELAAEADWRRG
ncbi:hypothetical protein BD779DRAFT_1478860 [Infundibulicybe gibba]|nr:hypothetical protein BD779DRAFT_1478860 [Infundibulicybe gibba]